MRAVQPEQLVAAHTRVRPVPFVPELRLHLADDTITVWEDLEADLAAGPGGGPLDAWGADVDGQLPPPFWACVWAGGQALARHLLDHPELARGRAVVDVATGSGLVALAASATGAAAVTACDVDPLAVVATRLNAALNAERCPVPVQAQRAAVADVAVPPGTLVTVGDAFYDEAIAGTMTDALCRLVAAGARVLVGDPHRAYLPHHLLREVASYDVQVDVDLEDAPVKRTVVAWLG